MTSDIVIVNWNSVDDTLRCLESVMPQVRRRRDVRVVVVDNGSTDRSILRIAGAFKEIVQVALTTNRGFTGGVAAGVEGGESDFVILLNNDATVEEGWLDTLITSLAEAPADVVACSGKIVSMDGKTIDFVEGALTFDGHAFQRDFRRPVGSAPEPAPGAELLFACGGNMIVRRAAFIELGAFDDDYFAYLEDVDFGWRAWISGYRVLFEPRAVARHRSSATSDRLGAHERGVLFERNALQTVVKNYSDELFAAALAPVFLTLLHRLHHYTTTRNGDATRLTAPPFHQAAPGFLGRLRGGSVISDPLTEMQFRATDWFFRNSERVMEKRKVVQSRRCRTDAEIFERFPLHIVPTYPGDDSLFSTTLFRAMRFAGPVKERTLDDMMAR